MKPKIELLVEVTAEVVMKGRKQVAFLHLGEQYPVKHEIWVDDERGALAPGNYLATEAYLSNEQYPRLLVGLNRLTPAK